MRGTCAILPLVVLAGLAACASPPEVRRPVPDFDVPGQWTAESETGAGNLSWGWWKAFKDPGLDSVVEQALARNHDLKAAAARLSQAEAQARLAGADLSPTLDLNLNARRQRQNFIGFPIPGGKKKVLSTTFTTYGVSLSTAWELDLWGRLRASARAGVAEMQAAEADLAGATLSLAAQATKAWFAAVEARQQVELAEATVKSWRTSLEEVRTRYERGVRPSLDVRLAASSLADAEAGLEARRRLYDAAVRQLEALAGRYPARAADVPAELPPLPGAVPAGLPADLVRRRPDLAAAERRLAAADARLAAAEAERYPRISLTASGGRSSEKLRDLLDGDYQVWNLAGNLVQPLFEGGRISANIDFSSGRAKEALEGFLSAALQAYLEVETRLAAEQYLAARTARLEEAARQAEAAARLAEARYRSGLSDYITLLESQRTALSARSRFLEARRLRLENRVDLYLALGGGFEQGRGEAAGGTGPLAARELEDRSP